MGDLVDERTSLPSTCFSCTRLNSTTFRIVEDDKYGEYPFIYVKVTDKALVLIDTGCGGATEDKSIELTALRTFLETYPVDDNNRAPLNADGRKHYIVVCSHCHYDHIGAIEQFIDHNSSIWASSYDNDFLSHQNLPTSSLSRVLDIPTPQYTITNWAHDAASLTHAGDDLGLTMYHTPGHTPDELAVWDPSERVLFVGDSLYEWVPIIFPKEGSLVAFFESMTKLRKLVQHWNFDSTKPRVTSAAGHCTVDVDAAHLLGDVEAFMRDVVDGKQKVQKEEENRGETAWWFEQEGGRLSVRVPKRLVEELYQGQGPIEIF